LFYCYKPNRKDRNSCYRVVNSFHGIRLDKTLETNIMIDKEQQDPNLQAPQEANTTKHINFLDAEEADASGTNDGTNKDSDDESPTKKAWEELRNENKTGPDSNQ
jgi:hypothetical protein